MRSKKRPPLVARGICGGNDEPTLPGKIIKTPISAADRAAGKAERINSQLEEDEVPHADR